MARDINQAWEALRRRDAPASKEGASSKQDILAKHFGDDWRTRFESRPPAPDADPPPDAADHDGSAPGADGGNGDDDPYTALGIDASATWEAIVEAHRALARKNHPDAQFGRSPAEAAAAETRIRVVNVAYQALRIRRGK